jgi:hypothetical protein
MNDFPQGYLEARFERQTLEAGARCPVEVRVSAVESARAGFAEAGAAGRRGGGWVGDVTTVDSYFHAVFEAELSDAILRNNTIRNGQRLAVIAEERGGRVAWIVKLGGSVTSEASTIAPEIIDNADGRVKARLSPFRVQLTMSAAGGPGIRREDPSKSPEYRLLEEQAQICLSKLKELAAAGHATPNAEGGFDFSRLTLEWAIGRGQRGETLGTITPATMRFSRDGKARCVFTAHDCSTRAPTREAVEGFITAWAWCEGRPIYRSPEIPIAVMPRFIRA